MGIANEEIVHYQGEGGGVGVVAQEHGGGGFREAVFGEGGDKAKLGQETRLGETRDSLEVMRVTDESKETKFCESGEGNGRHINADRGLRRGKNGT